MLKLVRRSTFETNNSSCHSVVLLAKDLPQTTSSDEEITLNLGEFGWGPYVVTDVHTKLSYWFTFAVNNGYDFDKEVFVSKLKEYYPNLKSIETPKGNMDLERFVEALKNDEFVDCMYSYIDHESTFIARKIVNEMSLSDYLSKECTLYIHNDNTDYGPRIDIQMANKLGITDKVANKIAEENSCDYYKSVPYELNTALTVKIESLGGTVIR